MKLLLCRYSNHHGNPLSNTLSARQEGRTNSFFILLFLSLFFIFPNFLLLSSDDLGIMEYAGNPLTQLAETQGGNGRYTFALLILAINSIGLGYESFLIISLVVFTLSLVCLFQSLANPIERMTSFSKVCGFLIFISFGPALDLYQYTSAYLSYGVGILSVAFAVSVATGSTNPKGRLILCSLIGAFGLGSYQMTGQLLLMAAALLLIIPVLSDATPEMARVLRRGAVILIASLVVAGVLYLAINAGLKASGAPVFAQYPMRPQGLAFVSANIPKYFETLGMILGWGPSIYKPLLPQLWRPLLAILMGWIVFAILYKRRLGWPLGLLALVLAIMAWPNPANLILGAYWPTARTFFGFGAFLGVLCAALFAAADRTAARGETWSIGMIFLGVFAASQCGLAVIRLQDRFLQQEADIALAQSIVTKAYENYGRDEPITIKLSTSWYEVGIARGTILDYGASLFAEPWSAPALLQYISGHRIAAKMAGPDDCRAKPERISYEKQQDGFLVCVRAP